MSATAPVRLAVAAALACALALPVAAAAEDPPSDAARAVGAAPAAGSAPAADYTYHALGRRDPFVSLVGRGESTQAPDGPRREGVQGLTTAELSVRGVLRSRGGYVAIVQGPDQKAHRVRAGDRLADGTIKTITPEGLVVVQEVNDPLSLVKQREIRKTLYGSDEGK